MRNTFAPYSIIPLFPFFFWKLDFHLIFTVLLLYVLTFLLATHLCPLPIDYRLVQFLYCAGFSFWHLLLVHSPMRPTDFQLLHVDSDFLCIFHIKKKPHTHNLALCHKSFETGTEKNI